MRTDHHATGNAGRAHRAEATPPARGAGRPRRPGTPDTQRSATPQRWPTCSAHGGIGRSPAPPDTGMSQAR